MLSLTLFAGVCLVVLAAELAFPQGREPSMTNRRFAIVAAMVTLPIFAVAGVLFHYAGEPLLMVGTVSTAALSLLTYDFFTYWLHRAQHHFAFLWRFHAVHHSIEEMGVPTGYHHVSEPFLRAAVCAVPTGFLVGGSGLAIVVLFTTFHGIYVHSRTRLNFGRIGAVIADNRVHRIHHSRDPAHHNRNFGVLTLLWDYLFGTAYFPAPGEWPEVGLDGHYETRTLAGLVTGLREQRADGDAVRVTQG